MTNEQLRQLDYKIAELIGDRLVDGKWISVNGSDIVCADGGPKYYSSSWSAMSDLVAALAKDDWRLTLTAPGGFTDEGLGGENPVYCKWSASFQRPEPEWDREQWPSYWDWTEHLCGRWWETQWRSYTRRLWIQRTMGHQTN